jgi:hypothetical protein
VDTAPKVCLNIHFIVRLICILFIGNICSSRLAITSDIWMTINSGCLRIWKKVTVTRLKAIFLSFSDDTERNHERNESVYSVILKLCISLIYLKRNHVFCVSNENGTDTSRKNSENLHRQPIYLVIYYL